MKLYNARITLFCIWVAIFAIYWTMLSLTGLKAGVTREQASESCWKINYVIFPVLAAFASFWFVPQASNGITASDNRKVDFGRLLAMFVLTGVIHSLVLLYFVVHVITPDFGFPDDEPRSYEASVDGAIKIFCVFSSILVLPVGFVLGTSGTPPVAATQKSPRPPDVEEQPG